MLWKMGRPPPLWKIQKKKFIYFLLKPSLNVSNVLAVLHILDFFDIIFVLGILSLNGVLDLLNLHD